MTERYINPFTDFGFKKLFGEESNKELLIYFLNEFLGEEGRIKKLSFLTTAQKHRLKEKIVATLFTICDSQTQQTHQKTTHISIDWKTVKDTIYNTVRQETRLSIAQRMKQNGESIEKIIQYTQLSKE